jgi:5-(carboxyamino)imidazole ribonucleotide synthase
VTTLGILGAGQLGRMLAEAAAPLGVRCKLYDPAPSPCARLAGEHVQGDWHDTAALDAFAVGLDHVTWEFENVPVAAVDHLRQAVPTTPSARSLHVAQDRLREKQMFGDLGLNTAPHHPADSEADLRAALTALGGPAIVKTRGGGYDGKGQARAAGPADAARVWDQLGDRPLIVEGIVVFHRELSVIAARGRDGRVVTWPLSWNTHSDGVLVRSIAPAPAVSPALALAAGRIGTEVVTRLEHVGTLCVELFDLGDRLLCNELAPRVHNSGHWTIEGSVTSQFDNHVRAVVGLPLQSTAMAHPVAGMRNWLGRVPAPLPSTGHPHDYGKEPRPGRKVGHLTITGPDLPSVLDQL